MKAFLNKPILTLLISLLCLLTYSCKKNENPNEIQKDEEIPIISELPIMYYGCNLHEGDTVHITDKTSFDTIFLESLISQLPVLQNIDLSKYDILVGADVYTHGISRLEHTFQKTDSSSYLYTVKVIYNDTLPAGGFYYGIIIEKLPSDAIIDFSILKIY